MMSKLLLHICCAPCGFVYSDYLSRQGTNYTLLWFNPNIHLFDEYKRRKNSVRKLADLRESPLWEVSPPELDNYLKAFRSSNLERCDYCYRNRIKKLAELAAEFEFTSISTTLLASVYQNHNQIIHWLNHFGNIYNLKVVLPTAEITEKYRKSVEISRDQGFYIQKYCGCVFSAEERYRSSKDYENKFYRYR